MGKLPRNAFDYIPFEDVSIRDSFWSKKVDATYKNTLPAILDQLKITGRWDVFKLNWKPGDRNPPHIFWDRYFTHSTPTCFVEILMAKSDTAKFLEAACYALEKRENNKLRADVEEQIDYIRNSQWDDGYINSYFTLVEPEN